MFKKIGKATNTKELQSIKSKYPEYDTMYVKSCVFGLEEEKLYWINLYNKNIKYLDKNFLQEIKINYNNRLWELYLISYFINKGYCLEENKENSPDICIRNNEDRIFIECVCSTKGEGDNKIHNIEDGYSGDVDTVDIPRKLRLTSVLKSKSDKILKYIDKGIINEKDIVLIAVNGGGSDGYILNNGIESILYGYGKTYYKKNNEKLSLPYIEEKKSIKNKNKTDISLKFFEDNKHISGVIYVGSNVHDLNDYKLEGIDYSIYNLGYGKLKLIENKFAKNKLNKFSI